MRKMMVSLLVASAALVVVALAGAFSSDTRVSVGSPSSPFSQNKQNEPALAADASRPNVLVAGANDEIDEEACNAGADNTCPFTPGVGVSGVYFSFDSGSTWTQPTYTGLTARNCLGVPGPTDPDCTPATGPIGTLPWYAENGLASDGDPAVAFGPKPGPNGFSWSNGSRLYYANLTSNIGATRKDEAFAGFEAIAVSRTDDVAAAAAGGAVGKQAWCIAGASTGCAPVIVSKQSSTTFSDKEQIWADNASQSKYFGTVYLCWASFRGQELGNAAPAPLIVAVSHDGGQTWIQHQITAAANNGQRNPLDGCTVRTDSNGNAYVFGVGTLSSAGKQAFEFVSTSSDGGDGWSKPTPVAGPVTQPGVTDAALGRPTIDGIAGARSDLAAAPSVDLANGAPTGADATNRIVMTYVSGTLAAPHVYFTESTDQARSWTNPRPIESVGDRGLYAAPAISPNGSDVYVVYNAFTNPYRTNTSDPRELVGVVKHADVGGGGTGAFGELHRSPGGDPRGTSQNGLTAEFLGDYVYAAATRDYGAAVWNDARAAADCPAIDRYRAGVEAGDPAATAPAVQQSCDPRFGNSEIYGGSYATP